MTGAEKCKNGKVDWIEIWKDLPIASSVTVECVKLEHVLCRARMPALELMLSRGVPCPPVFKLTMSIGVLAQVCPEVNKHQSASSVIV